MGNRKCGVEGKSLKGTGGLASRRLNGVSGCDRTEEEVKGLVSDSGMAMD